MSEMISPVFAKVDLNNCDREPIHIPGQIQPHGILLAVDPLELTVVQWSENAIDLFQLSAEQMQGCALEELVDAMTMTRVRRLVDTQTPAVITPLMSTLRSQSDAGFHLGSAHLNDGVLIVEFERESTEQILLHSTVDEGTESITRCVQRAIARLHACESLQFLFQTLAEEVRRLTGYDRVMVYRFMPDQHGVVEGEALREGLESYLGLHYPASDIPQQARRLYKLNLIRVIADLNAEPVPLVPELCPVHDRPLDLTYSSFRSVSPIHIEYLRNMGVAASMSISILHDGELWGLIACHHYSPRNISLEVRAACELLGSLAGSYVVTKQISEEIHLQTERQALLADALHEVANYDSIESGLISVAEHLQRVVDAQGLAICWHDHIELLGTTPPRDFVEQLCRHMANAQRDVVWATDHLASEYPPAYVHHEEASGVLVLQLGRKPAETMIFFRPQYVNEVRWGGNPEKSAEVDQDGVRLSPRKSFAQWTQEVRNQSRPWTRVDRLLADDLYAGLMRSLAHRSSELLRVNEELLRLNSDLDSFAYAASHDLKEPLRTISQTVFFLERALADNRGDEVKKRVEAIQKTTQRMTDLLEGLLRVSRAGSSDLHLEQTQLRDVVQDAAELALNHADDGEIELIVGTLPTVFADFMCLRDVFQNLFANSRKYAVATKKRIEVGSVILTADHSPPPGWQGKQAIYVKDNGIGIAKERLSDVFQVFRRLHQPGEYGGGSGVGLAIVKRVIERHGGVVWATSEAGAGSTFYFTLEALSRGA